MNIRNRVIKKMVLFAAVATVLSNGAFVAHAQDLSEETAAYGWSEAEESGIAELSDYTGEPVWTLRDTKDVAVDAGTINLKSYTMVLLNDTKMCKGVTVHSSRFWGFVRARFETIFGQVHEGSDSGRVKSFYGDTAETKDSISGGWNGIAHTYCDSLPPE